MRNQNLKIVRHWLILSRFAIFKKMFAIGDHLPFFWTLSQTAWMLWATWITQWLIFNTPYWYHTKSTRRQKIESIGWQECADEVFFWAPFFTGFICPIKSLCFILVFFMYKWLLYGETIFLGPFPFKSNQESVTILFRGMFCQRSNDSYPRLNAKQVLNKNHMK